MDILPGFEKYVLKEFFNLKIQPLLKQVYLLERENKPFQKENLKLKYFFQGITFFLKLKNWYTKKLDFPKNTNQWKLLKKEKLQIKITFNSNKELKDWESLFSKLFLFQVIGSTEVLILDSILD